MNMPYIPKRVLVVKLNKVGDTIAFLPTLNALRTCWTSAHITLLTTSVGNEICEKTGLVDKIWVASLREPKTIAGFLRLFKLIRGGKFDMAFASSDTSSALPLLFFLSRIPRRIGFSNPKLSRLYTTILPFSNITSHVMLNLILAQKTGCPINADRPVIRIPEETVEEAMRKLREKNVLERDDFVILHTGSATLTSAQLLPAQKFVDLIEWLSKQGITKFIFVGSQAERREPLPEGKTVPKSSIIDMRGLTKIKELMHMIAKAKLFIGHPSGPLQIAFLMGTPSLSFWGPSSWEIWGPAWEKDKHLCIRPQLDCIGCQATFCRKETFECVHVIAMDEVIQRVSERGLLQR